jgi:hypothetical protein
MTHYFTRLQNAVVESAIALSSALHNQWACFGPQRIEALCRATSSNQVLFERMMRLSVGSQSEDAKPNGLLDGHGTELFPRVTPSNAERDDKNKSGYILLCADCL